MSNYRRLISYIYAYEGGIKGKNIGFAKIETRGIQCKITVSAKRIYVGGNDIGVYLLAGDQEIFLGNIFVRGGSGEFRTTVSANDVERSSISMDQCFGLTIHDVKSTWRSYTTIWEDAVAHAAEVDLENAISASRDKAQTEISEEQIKRAVKEIEEEFPLETDVPKTFIEKSEAHTESIRTEQEPVERENLQVQAESGETSGESLVHEGTASEEPVLRETASEEPILREMASEEPAPGEMTDEEPALKEMASEEPVLREMTSEESTVKDAVSEETASRSEISEEINKDAISEAATGERLLNSNPARGDLAGESLPDENPASGEKIAEALNEEALPDEESVEASTGTLYSGNTVNEDLAGEILNSREPVNEHPAGEHLLHSEESVNEELTGGNSHSEQPVNENTGGNNLVYGEKSISEESVSEESVNEKLASEESAGGEPVIEARTSDGAGPENLEWNKQDEPEQPVSSSRAFASAETPPQAPFSPTTGPVPERRPLPRQFMSGWRQRNQPSAARTMPAGQPLPRPAAQGVPPVGQPLPRPVVTPMGQPLPRPAAQGTPPTIQPLPHPEAAEPFAASRPLPHPSAPAPALFGQPSLNQQNAAQESRGNERNEAFETQVKGTGSSQPAEMTFSEPCIPQNDQDIAGSTVCYQADAVIKEAPGSGGTQPSLGNPEELERLLQTEDSDEVPHDLIWEKLKHEHTRILAFDYEDGCEILTIKPQDIGILPRETWVFGNNSFLLHGYYNYRYLILAKLLNPQGDPRYILGIPGHFYSNERYMASMFGFPNFVLSKEQPVEDGRFGFWYTDIKLGGL